METADRLSQRRSWLLLGVLVCLQTVIYAWLSWLSIRFHFSQSEAQRPILFVLMLLALLFTCSLASLALAVRLPISGRLVWGILAVAIVFRCIMLISHPIQEVDLYRYIWDGSVSNQGVSPYRFSPASVLVAAGQAGESEDPEIAKLVANVNSNPGLRDVLDHVHFGELPTVYPPVSQAVFRISDWLTPGGADLNVRQCVMKCVIVCFDVGVMLLLWQLLRITGLHPGWCIAYGWSPLVIKEFANSGHLDSIAVFLMLASVVCLVRQSSRLWVSRYASGCLLGMAVGAKLFPIVLAPLLAVFIWRRWGRSWLIGWSVTFVLATSVCLLPMFLPRGDTPSSGYQLDGLKAFLARWEINDVIFMAVEENMRADRTVAGQPNLWFVFTPNEFRENLTTRASRLLACEEERVPFLMARLLLMFVFGGIVLSCLIRTWRDQSALYESAFLILAWFWLLSPTQNPWYWTWALPLVPFARNRSWLLIAGLVLIYYSRFWFQYHAGTLGEWHGYRGVAIFDFVVVWVEFVPFALLLLASWCFQRKTA